MATVIANAKNNTTIIASLTFNREAVFGLFDIFLLIGLGVEFFILRFFKMVLFCDLKQR